MFPMRGSLLKHLRGTAIALIAIQGVAPATAWSQAAFGNQEAAVLLKGLSYDRQASTRSGTGAILLIYQGPNKADADKVAAILAAAGPNGPVKVSANAFTSVAELMAILDRSPHSAIFVHASAAPAIASIVQVSRGRKIPSLAHSADMVEKGIAIGIKGSADSAKLTVNLRAAKTEGIDLPAAVLSSAVVIP